MKNAKIGVVRGLGVTQSHQQHNIQYSVYDFLFDFNRNYVFILVLFFEL